MALQVGFPQSLSKKRYHYPKFKDLGMEVLRSSDRLQVPGLEEQDPGLHPSGLWAQRSLTVSLHSALCVNGCWWCVDISRGN
jgi:hypothetical protein